MYSFIYILLFLDLCKIETVISSFRRPMSYKGETNRNGIKSILLLGVSQRCENLLLNHSSSYRLINRYIDSRAEYDATQLGISNSKII